MRLAPFAGLLACLLLAACAGHSLECETGTAREDCAPGTEGHARLLEQREDARTIDALDDARCRSFAPPGSQAYLACRRRAANDRSSFDAR
ncbi:MAG TPA: hypothetical protein VFL51_17465 [Pseudolabrys sp.]|nr:hypothetical protein [Pseudolabrys sp.]